MKRRRTGYRLETVETGLDRYLNGGPRTSPRYRLPNFFVIGAHKCGTTSLFNLIRQHPDVDMPYPKEPSFFSLHYGTPRALHDYRSLFSPVQLRGRALGEASTTYSQVGRFPHVPGLIRKYCPKAKFIYLVRDPLARIESAWIQYRSEGRGDVSSDFGQSLMSCPQLIDASLYNRQFNAYRDLFGGEAILVLSLNALTCSPGESCKTIFNFLGVGADFEVDTNEGHLNTSETKSRLPPWMDAVRSRGSRLLPAEGRMRAAAGRLKEEGKRLVGKEIERPVWDAETLAWVSDVVWPDFSRFCQQTKIDQHMWGTGIGGNSRSH